MSPPSSSDVGDCTSDSEIPGLSADSLTAGSIVESLVGLCLHEQKESHNNRNCFKVVLNYQIQ